MTREIPIARSKFEVLKKLKSSSKGCSDFVLVALSALFLDSTTAAEDEVYSIPAGDEEPTNTKERSAISHSSKTNRVVFSGQVGLVSDFVKRGATQTLKGPAGHGELTLGQRKHDGAYIGAWFSNVSNTKAPNGAGMELDLFAGYVYKRDQDLSLKFEVRNTRYPGAYFSLPTKDKLHYVEIIPAVSYKIFSLYVAYALTNYQGINQNVARTYPVFVASNGNSKGSCFMEACVNIPISFISDRFKFRVTAGYEYVRNYTVLNYAVYTTGLKYKLPESWGGISLFANASATTANKKYYKVTDSFGKVTNTVAPRVWAGISKRF